MRILGYTLIAFLFVWTTTDAQLAENQEGHLAHFYQGKSLYEQEIYPASIQQFQKFFDQLDAQPAPDLERYEMEARYYVAISSIKTEQPDAEQKILSFVNNYKPDPFAERALINVANYYFDQREYDLADEYFKKVNINSLTAAQLSEVQFKKGYIKFNQKQYGQARQQFESVKNIKNDYYLPTNYYLALCYYYQGNYEKAIPYLEKVESSRRYNRYIPSYLAQIYYQLEQYDRLIQYAPEKLEERSVQDKDKIAYVLGLAYIQKENYQEALPLLETYARSNKLSKEDHFQIAYARYETGNYEGAISGFQKVSDLNNRMGQNANLLLADCYLRLEDRESARNAFANASRRSADDEIAAEAKFNYGKLSAEMGFDREAVNALSSFEASSPYFGESQDILSDLFLNTRDYDKAIAIIESFEQPSPELKKAYQQVTYLKAVQSIQDDENRKALQYLEKSLSSPVDPYFTTLATFWKGDLLYKESEYTRSSTTFNAYFTLAKNVANLPSIAAPFMAEYTQGYNYLKRNNYRQAEDFFKSAVLDIKRNKVNIDNVYIEQNVYADALLRYGDCLFKRNAYDLALDQYDEAVRLRTSGFVYALFQKAIILGLQQKPYEKIIALEDLVKSYPTSAYADDALLELGITYTELGKLNDAVAPLTRLVNEYRNSSDLIVNGLLRLGLISYNLGDTQAALNHYKSVFDFNPSPEQSKEALASIEEIYVQDIGDANAYVEFLEQTQGVKVEASEKEKISFRAAEAKFENGEYGAATEAYGRYLKQFPKGAHVLASHFRKGESHLVLKQYSEALNEYKSVISKGPSTYYAPSTEKAALIAYNHEKDFAQATEYYLRWSKVATSEEDRFEAQLGGLEAAYRAGMSKEVNDLVLAVMQHPNATNDHKATAQFYKGKLAFDKNLLNEAVTAFNEVSRLSDNELTAEARYLIARIYYLQNEYELAETLTKEAYKESSNYPYWVAQSLILLSDILVAKEDYFNAKAALEVVIENFKEDEETLEKAKQKLETIKALDNE